MSSAVIRFAWNDDAVGKGSAYYNLTSDSENIYWVLSGKTVAFEFRSGDAPKGITLPKKGTLIQAITGGVVSETFRDVRFESGNHADGMFYVPEWSLTEIRKSYDDYHYPVYLHKEWYPNGRPVPKGALWIQLRKIA